MRIQTIFADGANMVLFLPNFLFPQRYVNFILSCPSHPEFISGSHAIQGS